MCLFLQILVKKCPVVIFSGLLRSLNTPQALHGFVQDVAAEHECEAFPPQLATLCQALSQTRAHCNAHRGPQSPSHTPPATFGRALEPLQSAARGMVDVEVGQTIDLQSLMAVMRAFRDSGEEPPFELRINHSAAKTKPVDPVQK